MGKLPEGTEKLTLNSLTVVYPNGENWSLGKGPVDDNPKETDKMYKRAVETGVPQLSTNSLKPL